ncbi:MAG: hypothetical protein AAGG56_01560 [Pseudomonadota bacterium]
MNTITKTEAARITGGFTSPSGGEAAAKRICESLDGALWTRPDGSTQCRFSLPEPAIGGGTAEGRFIVDAAERETAEAISRQLGGRVIAEGPQVTCSFRLPATPRWSIQSVSKTSCMVNLDPETRYLCSAGRGEASIKVLENGEVIEDMALTYRREAREIWVETTGADGVSTAMQLGLLDEILTVRYLAQGKLVFEVAAPVTTAETRVAALYARHPWVHPKLPHLDMLLERLQGDRGYHELLLQSMGLAIVPPTEADTVNFCSYACKACLWFLSPHACVVWAFCMGYQSPTFFGVET